MNLIFRFLAIFGISGAAFALTNAEVADFKDLESVVFYSSTQFDRNGQDEGLGFCNGNLISSRVMITAAHCVFMAEASGKRTINLQVGEYRYVTRSTGERIRVGYAASLQASFEAKFFFTSDVQKRLERQKYRLSLGPAEDIAVVVFDTEVPVKPGFIFHQPVKQSDVDAIIKQLAIYKPTVVTINPIEEMSTNFKRMAHLEKLKKTFSGYLESNSKARVQPGDSGAPLLVRVGAEWKQLGVTKGKASTFFSDWDVYGILDQRLCNISAQIPDRVIQQDLCY